MSSKQKSMSNLPIFADNISKSFGRKVVLDNLSLSVSKGEIHGIIGLNGVGKTTLIKIMLGLMNQDSGYVSFFNQDISRASTRKLFSYLPEKFQPSNLLKGREFLSLTLSYYSKKYNHKIAQEKAKQLHLDPDVLDWKITKYSKGMVQKLGLLSALLTDPQLLILDEPMSGLDPRARILLKEHLQDFSKSGKTILLSSHIISDIDEICHKMSILHNSKIIYTGTPKNFKKLYPKKSLEYAFLDAIEQEQRQHEKTSA